MEAPVQNGLIYEAEASTVLIIGCCGGVCECGTRNGTLSRIEETPAGQVCVFVWRDISFPHLPSTSRPARRINESLPESSVAAAAHN